MTRSLPCFALVVATLLTAGCASAGEPRDLTRQTSAPFSLVNATDDSVAGVAVAPAGTEAFDVVDLGAPLTGGLTSTAFQLPQGPCLRDLRVTFRDDRVARLNGVDVCRTHGLRLDATRGRLPTPSEADQLASGTTR